MYIGLARKSVWVFLKVLCKNPNKLFGQPPNWYRFEWDWRGNSGDGQMGRMDDLMT